MSHTHLSKMPSRTLSVLLFLFMVSCGDRSTGRDACEIARFHPTSGYNHADTRLLLEGKGFAEKLSETVKLEMWQAKESRLLNGFSLSNLVFLSPNRASATIPAGVDPGRYSLVVRQDGRMRFLPLSFHVLSSPHNTGPPSIVRVLPGSFPSNETTRITATGANLNGVLSMELIGPLPSKGDTAHKHPLARSRWPFRPRKPIPLLKVRQRSGARISATVPPGLLPGTYAIRIRTSTHRSHPPDLDNLTRITTPKGGLGEAAKSFIIYFAVMGAVFLLGMMAVFRQGDVGFTKKAQKLNFWWMLSGFLFTFILLGLFQFVFSSWY